MSQQLIARGAEAKIYLDKGRGKIVKDRIKKSYRIPEIDNKLRTSRTKSEAKLLEKASKIINCPKPLAIPQFGRMIHMQFIKGKKLSEYLNTITAKQAEKICESIGKQVAILHKENIIHGDLTTSNMILKEDNIFFIDFGLGFISARIEDKAVDLHLLRQALEAKHFKDWQKLFNSVIKAYKEENREMGEKVLKQFEKVEARGRYKH